MRRDPFSLPIPGVESLAERRAIMVARRSNLRQEYIKSVNDLCGRGLLGKVAVSSTTATKSHK